MTLNSREKGKRGERELATYLQTLGYDAKRGLSQSRGAEQADVVGLPGYHLEVKRQERLEVDKWVEQARRDARNGDEPLVVYRKNHQAWRAIISFDALMELIAAAQEIA